MSNPQTAKFVSHGSYFLNSPDKRKTKRVKCSECSARIPVVKASKYHPLCTECQAEMDDSDD